MSKDVMHPLPEANISQVKRKFLDIPYADGSESEKLDIYLPDAGDGPFPAIFFIHGGAWRAGDKADGQVQYYLDLIQYGYAVVSINYRLSGEACFPAGFLDCKAAFDFLKAHAEQYRIDPENIALAGNSAGAYYVLMLVGAKVPVRCAVSWYGVTDLEAMAGQHAQNGRTGYSHSDPNSPEARHLGRPVAQASAELLLEASPIYHIHADMPPILLQHGDRDALVPHQQAVTYYERVKEIAGADRVMLELFSGAGHGDAVFKQPQNMQRVRKFLDAFMKRDADHAGGTVCQGTEK